MPQQIGVVIPCFNEASRLPVRSLESFISAHSDVTFCFVNDGSTDGTLPVLNELKSKFEKRVQVLDNRQNLGKAESVRKGMIHLIQDSGKFEMVGFLDADLSASPQQFYKLCLHLRAHSLKAVFGSRIKRLGSTILRSPSRHYIGRIFATLIGHITQLPVYDSQCGAKVFEVSYLPGILVEPFQTKWLFDVELILRITNSFGQNKFIETVHEYPLERWVAVGDSKIAAKEFFRVPLELWEVYRISRKNK